MNRVLLDVSIPQVEYDETNGSATVTYVISSFVNVSSNVGFLFIRLVCVLFFLFLSFNLPIRYASGVY